MRAVKGRAVRRAPVQEPQVFIFLANRALSGCRKGIMVRMTTVTGLAGELASRLGAQTAVVQPQLSVLASAYDDHVVRRARIGHGPDCGHAGELPYIVIPVVVERAWCAACVNDALPAAGLPCEECPGVTALYMFSYGEIVVAANLCQDCGGNPRLS